MTGNVDSGAWARTVLGRLPAYRVIEIPRAADPGALPGDGSRGHPGRARRTGALLAAYHAGVADGGAGTVAYGWLRTATAGPVDVFVAGATLVGTAAPDAEADVLLAVPAGAHATALTPGELAGLLERIGCWRKVGGISDGLLVPSGETALPSGRGTPADVASLDDGLLGSWTGPFGWLVIAEPVPGAELHELAAAVALRLRVAEGTADRYPERAAQARRLRERHAEFQRGLSTGFWRITVAAGGADQASAARVAGLVCGATDLRDLPYALSPAPVRPAASDAGATDVSRAGSPAEPGGDALPAAPFYGSTDLLAALLRAPESEVPGVRLTLQPEFDVTPETPAGGRSAGIEIGTVLDRNLMPAGSCTVSPESLNRHVFVCGATGSGKSQTVRSLLAGAAARGIPWLVIEPAKAEYKRMANRLPGTEVVRIRPGEPDSVAAGFNPLAPAVAPDGTRFPLQTHADLVKALFIASFRSEEPFPQVLSAALGRVYEEAGWDLALGEPRCPPGEYPSLHGLQRAAERVVTEIGYSQRVTDDVLGFIRVRLASLRHGTTGRFLEGGHPLDFGTLLRANVVLEIEDVGDDSDKAFLMGAVLIRLIEQLRLTHRVPAPGSGTALRHLTVIEEAHRLLRGSEPGAAGASGAAGHAVEMFAGLLAEIRAYGEGLVIAEQIPARLTPDAIKNTAVKIVHRLPAADDRDAVGATMNVTPAQSRYLVTLPPGRAAVCFDGMDFPVLAQIQDGTEGELASPPHTSDARRMVTPRSASCGPQCADRPCTLREIRIAQRTLDEFQWVRLWAEFAVLGHLTGWPAPVPKPAVLLSFAALPARVTQCATAQAVDAAVAARPMISQAAALAAHLTAAFRARTERCQWFCGPDEPDWLLAGETTRDVIFGVARPAPIEQAGSMTAALSQFVDCDWPHTVLRRVAAAPGG